MKQYKALIISFVFAVLPLNTAFAIAGFGLQFGQSMFSVNASNPATGSEYITLTNGAFDGGLNFGGYLYLDIIPFIDLEADFTTEYQLKNGAYFFLIEGEVLVAGEKLQKRDAIGISEIKKVVIKANQQSKLLVIDVPMS